MNSRRQAARLALIAAFSAAASVIAHGQRTLRVDTVTLTDGDFGLALSAVGDIDSDGVIDYATVSPRTSFVAPGEDTVFLISGRDGSLLRSVPELAFTNGITGVGDLTGDGIPDVVTCAPFEDGGEFSQGAVELRSGADLSVVHTTFGSSMDVSLGFSGAVSTGDVNGDGIDDYCTSELERLGISDAAWVVLSGADGTTLRERRAAGPQFLFFNASEDMGDLDADGVRDFAAVESSAQGTRVVVYSATTGAELFERNDVFSGWTGFVANADDVDGDGHDDIYVHWGGNGTVGSPGPYIGLFSGATGAEIDRVRLGDTVLRGLASGGDVDGDGSIDLVLQVASSGSSSAIRGIVVLSGATRTEIARWNGSAPGDFFGVSVACLGNVDGMPGDELAIGVPLAGTAGEVHIVGYDGGVGSSFCTPATPNSTGRPGQARLVLGPASQASLLARDLPNGTFCLGLASRTPTTVIGPGGSQGTLCVGGSVGRFGGVPLPQATRFGAAELALSLNAIPTPTGPVSAQPGETWYFQVWYRDANPVGTSNLTSAVMWTL
ncbi:MAG: hypothetical protein AAF726_21535 [Planctomycetota bacterium]